MFDIRKKTINSKYDLNHYIDKKIEEANQWFSKKVSEIEKMNDCYLKRLRYITLIDLFAQETFDYNKKRNKESFIQFVLDYQNKYDYLNEVEPITYLYHRIQNGQFDYSKYDAISSIVIKTPNYTFKELLENGEANNIINLIGSYDDDLMEKHKLIYLLYQLRSKAVHEMKSLGSEFDEDDNCLYDEPYYNNSTVLALKYSYETYSLVIPNSFIKNLTIDCVNNYLESCKIKRKLPFENNKNRRYLMYSWYDDKQYNWPNELEKVIDMVRTLDD